jgi:hypothetical protein
MKKIEAAKQKSVTALYFFVLSTNPPIRIPPTNMANSNPAPAKSIESCECSPPRLRTSSMKVPYNRRTTKRQKKMFTMISWLFLSFKEK